MYFRNLKEDDLIYCHTSATVTLPEAEDTPCFKTNKYYKIGVGVYHSGDDFLIQVFDDSDRLIKIKESRFNAHFYTISEIRMMKLQKIRSNFFIP